MTAPYELLVHRPLHDPVLVLGMEGWIDAGGAAAAALAHVLDQVETEVMARWDGDQFVDQRARRPVVRIVDGLNAGLTWPDIELQVGVDSGDRSVLFLTGPEPDVQWRLFVRSVVGVAADLGVALVCGLGAFPAPVPHTRPVRLAATATTRELADDVGFVSGTIDVPAGIHAALEEGFAAAGTPAVGLWARVPHYASAMPYPAAAAALVDGLARVAEMKLDATELHAAAAVAGGRIDELISASEEHTRMVRQLETAVDEAEPAPFEGGPLPSGDEIAAELERFLRGQR
jgi:hypothetical protein